jgi:hypothetical protein
MAAPRFVPSDSTLAKWRDEGLTAKQIVARIKERDGVEVAVGTIYAALSRAGLTEQIRYDDYIPWQVRPDHANAFPLVMLRLAARRADGQTLPAEREAKLDRWIARLEEEDAVVAYVRDSADGFHYVHRRPGIDTGLIRVPD